MKEITDGAYELFTKLKNIWFHTQEDKSDSFFICGEAGNSDEHGMKNRNGDEFHWEKINDNEYKFVMSGTSIEYCRMGGRQGQREMDMNDLGFFDPAGGPFVGVGDEFKGADNTHRTLTVTHIRHDGENFIAEVV